MGMVEPDAHAFGLDLHNKGLKVILGEKLSAFPKLRSLDLSFNGISTVEGLEALKDLRELKLYGNNIQQLAVLHLQSNRIEKIPPNAFKHLSRLKTLRLDNNRLTEVQHLSWCRSLTNLDLSRNALTTLKGIAGLVNVQILDVAHNDITQLAGLEHCVRLLELNAGQNAIADPGVAALKACSQLATLKLDHNKLTQLGSLPQLNGVTELSLAHNRLTSVEALPAAGPALDYLDLSHNRLDSCKAACDALKQLPELREVTLVGNPFSPVDALSVWWAEVHEMVPHLQVIEDVPASEGIPGSLAKQLELKTTRFQGMRPLSGSGERPSSKSSGARPGDRPVLKMPNRRRGREQKVAPLDETELIAEKWRNKLWEVKDAMGMLSKDAAVEAGEVSTNSLPLPPGALKGSGEGESARAVMPAKAVKGVKGRNQLGRALSFANGEHRDRPLKPKLKPRHKKETEAGKGGREMGRHVCGSCLRGANKASGGEGRDGGRESDRDIVADAKGATSCREVEVDDEEESPWDKALAERDVDQGVEFDDYKEDMKTQVATAVTTAAVPLPVPEPDSRLLSKSAPNRPSGRARCCDSEGDSDSSSVSSVNGSVAGAGAGVATSSSGEEWVRSQLQLAAAARVERERIPEGMAPTDTVTLPGSPPLSNKAGTVSTQKRRVLSQSCLRAKHGFTKFTISSKAQQLLQQQGES